MRNPTALVASFHSAPSAREEWNERSEGNDKGRREMETVTIVGWLRLIHLPLVSLAVSIVLRLTATRLVSERSEGMKGA